jgi:hypothetical protein
MEMHRKLNRSMEQCQSLAQSLRDTTDQLHVETCKNAEREWELSPRREVTVKV